MCIFCDGAIYYMLKIITTEIAARDSAHATNITHAAHPGERNHARYNRALVILRNLRTRYWFTFTVIGFIFTTNFYSHIFARVGTRQQAARFSVCFSPVNWRTNTSSTPLIEHRCGTYTPTQSSLSPLTLAEYRYQKPNETPKTRIA